MNYSYGSDFEIDSNTNACRLLQDTTKEVNFNDFILEFPEKKFPFDIAKELIFKNKIEDDYVNRFIDRAFSNKNAALLEEAGDYDYYYPTEYYYAARFDIKNKYVLTYATANGASGPIGNYTIAIHHKTGKLIDSIGFDVREVYLNGTQKVIIYKDSIVWTGAGSIEIIKIVENGHFLRTNSKKLKITPQGLYPQSSTRQLTRTELKKRSKHDLQIMRNEIFARYGYIFKEGGEMDKYFKSQDWYTPQHKNVNNFLTEIEKANLKLIKEMEAE